jgi:hypothetical protein
LSAAEGIFSRLHRAETLLANEKTRPAFLSEKNFAKLADAFGKSFPKIPPDPVKVCVKKKMGRGRQINEKEKKEKKKKKKTNNFLCKNSGYAHFITEPAQQVHDLLAPQYYTFVDHFEWHSAARDVILEIGKGATCLKYEINPTLTEGFLDLVQVYMRLLFVLQRIDARQVVMSTFCRAYFHLKYVAEPSFDKAADFVYQYSDVVSRVQFDFRPVASIIVDAIMTLQMPFLSGWDVSSLRTKVRRTTSVFWQFLIC